MKNGKAIVPKGTHSAREAVKSKAAKHKASPSPAGKGKPAGKPASNGAGHPGAPSKGKKPLPQIFYDSGGCGYYMPNERGGWVRINESGARLQLRMCGYSAKVPEKKCVSPLEVALSAIQKTQDVSYAGPLAGYGAGIYSFDGLRVLVTDSPRMIEPAQGDWPTIRALVEGLLRDGEHDQTPYFYGWLKIAVTALRASHRRPGQLLAIAGPHGCGKSLLQSLITLILGGREARPYRYMRGGSEFNAELFGAEHLVIEDEQPSNDLRVRRNFGARVKEITVNTGASCHGKGRQALSLKPFWRVSISLNDEPENLMVLPPLDESLVDKIILFRASRCAMPMPTNTTEERDAFMAALRGELAAFIGWLLAWEIPAALASPRFGIIHFQHPALVEALSHLAPEMRFLQLVDMEIFRNGRRDAWEGTAAELESLLTHDASRCARGARRSLNFANACGTYLARLADMPAPRVARHRSADARKWTILPG